MRNRTLRALAGGIAVLAVAVTGLAACSTSDTTAAPSASKPRSVNPDAAFVYLVASQADTFGDIADEASAAGDAVGDFKMAEAVRHADRVSVMFGGLVSDFGDKPETKASPLGRTTIAMWTQCKHAWSDSAAAIAAIDASAMTAATADVKTCTAGSDSLSASVTELTGA